MNMSDHNNMMDKKFYASSRVYRKKINDAWVLFAPDYQGFPVVVDDNVYNIFNEFQSGFVVNDFIQHYYSDKLNLTKDPNALVEKIFFLINKGLIRHSPDAACYKAQDFTDINQIQSLVFWIHITNRCNLGCQYCFVNTTNNDMSKDTIENVVLNIAKTIRTHQIKDVTLKFAGGEPTLALNSIKQFYQSLSSQLEGIETKIKISILSNGTYISDEMIDFLKAHKGGMGISLDGYGETGHDLYRKFKKDQTGSWKIILDNIDRLQSHDIRPYIMGTVSRASSHSLTDLAAWVIEKGLSTRLSVVRSKEEFIETSGGDSTEESHKKYIDHMINAFENMFVELEKEKYSFDVGKHLMICDLRFDRPSFSTCCGIGTGHIIVNENGKLASCPMLVNQAAVEMNEDLLIDIRKTVNFSPKTRNEQNHQCLLCQWFPVCAGGCPVYNDEVYGDPLAVSVLHDFYDYVIPRYVDFFGRKLLQTNHWKSNATADL